MKRALRKRERVVIDGSRIGERKKERKEERKEGRKEGRKKGRKEEKRVWIGDVIPSVALHTHTRSL